MNLPYKSRRAFIKNTIMGSAALMSYPWLEALANEPAVSMLAADKVRIGIVGTGSRGQGLLHNLLAIETTHNIEIAAICDNYEPNYQKAIEITHGKAKAFYDYRELLDIKDIDAIDYIRSGKIGVVTQIRAYWHRNNDWRRPVPEGKLELDRKINWRLYKEYSCGLMTELASHQIQIANWVKDAQPVSVIGVGGIKLLERR